jgi:predicted transcriptional regulator
MMPDDPGQNPPPAFSTRRIEQALDQMAKSQKHPRSDLLLEMVETYLNRQGAPQAGKAKWERGRSTGDAQGGENRVAV